MAIYTGYNIVFIYVLDKYSLGPEAKTRWVLEKKNYFGNKIKSQIHNLLPSDGREGQVQITSTDSFIKPVQVFKWGNWTLKVTEKKYSLPMS